MTRGGYNFRPTSVRQRAVQRVLPGENVLLVDSWLLLVTAAGQPVDALSVECPVKCRGQLVGEFAFVARFAAITVGHNQPVRV
jgi:hypothetical protein